MPAKHGENRLLETLLAIGEKAQALQDVAGVEQQRHAKQEHFAGTAPREGGNRSQT